MSEGKIMVVDDNPANLKLLEGMLRRKGYDVRSFPLGRLALSAAAHNPPDLILLDVNMPEMNGYEVCERLKSIEVVHGTPVLFITALNQNEDKVRGFRSGGADYISKPFQLEEVYARVETHIKLRRALQAEQDLLERTLNGAIRMLSDLVHAASPELAARSRAIRDCVAWIIQRLAIDEPWRYDLAATLSLIGCIALPEETFRKGYGGEVVSPEEEAMFRTHPEIGARLLRNIPRLEPIAEMIRMQQRPDADPAAPEKTKRGARMLFLALELDRRIYRGVPFHTALQQLKSVPGRFDPSMLSALENYAPAPSEFHHRILPIQQLFPGMVLEMDVLSESTGMMILREGTILTGAWIERLGNFARYQGVKEPLRVSVPGPVARRNNADKRP